MSHLSLIERTPSPAPPPTQVPLIRSEELTETDQLTLSGGTTAHRIVE
jgi:hypothetical protein